jgi:TRAP-type C4-dicarboxylate transport system permease small subunit
LHQTTPKALKWAEKQLGLLAGLFAISGGVVIAALMLITIIGVFWRYVLNNPIFGIEDVSTMALTIVVAASVAYGAHHHSHVSVNIITMVAGRKVTRITDVLARGLGFATLAVATYALFKKGGCGLPCGAITNNLSIVHSPYYYILAVAVGSYAALLLVHLLIGLVHWNGLDPNEALD